MNKPTTGSDTIYRTEFHKLETLLDIKGDTAGLWSEEEYAEIWQRQLQAPLAVDLRGGEAAMREGFDRLQAAVPELPRTFGELFQHPDPPVDLLRLVKEHGKEIATQHRADAAAGLPPEMGTVLYLVAVAAAWLKGRERIGARQDAGLRQALEKALGQPWLDAATRALLQQACDRLSADG